MVGDVLHLPKSFNNSGSLFAHCASSGKLLIWDTATGTLKQEFARGDHLNITCTCILWIQISKYSGHKRKKTKSSLISVGNNLNVIALGTSLGGIIFYDVTTNSLLTELKEHSGKINGLTWSNKLNSLFSCSDDRYIIEWNLMNYKIKSKWKVGKEKIQCILALSSGKYLLSAGCSIKLWDLEQKQVIKVFVGHGTEVISLVEVTNKASYFVSAAKGDRVLNIWSLNLAEKKSNQVASLILQNPAVSIEMVQYENEQPTELFVLTEDGLLHIFKHKFNGSLNKPIKPAITVSLASGNIGSKHSRPIAIQAVHPLENHKIFISYGNPGLLTFETIALSELDEENVVLIRKEQNKIAVNDFNSKTKSPFENADAEYQTGSSALKRGNKKELDVPLEERLENLALAYPQLNDGPKKDNMAQLLLQGLQSKDKTILQSVLMQTEPSVIDVTVRNLPVSALIPLIRELTFFMQGKTFANKSVVGWLQSVIRVHSGILLSNADVGEIFEPLLASIEGRITVLTPLLKLKGRLALVTDQMEYNSNKNVENYLEPLYTYQEESSDEGDIDKMSEKSITDSNDDWDEYSDMEEDMDDK